MAYKCIIEFKKSIPAFNFIILMISLLLSQVAELKSMNMFIL